jgi:hypothetical protein
MYKKYWYNPYRDAYEESMSDLLDFEQYKLDWASTSAIDKYYPPEMRRVPIILERKQRVNKGKKPSKSKKITSKR